MSPGEIYLTILESISIFVNIFLSAKSCNPNYPLLLSPHAHNPSSDKTKKEYLPATIYYILPPKNCIFLKSDTCLSFVPRPNYPYWLFPLLNMPSYVFIYNVPWPAAIWKIFLSVFNYFHFYYWHSHNPLSYKTYRISNYASI